VYLFGGITPDVEPSAEIVRYNPATDQVTVLAHKMPEARWGWSAVWSGSAAYIFGGFPCARPCPVIKFDPVSGASNMTVGFDTAMTEAAATWDGSRAYILGGREWGSSTKINNTIWKFTPAGGTLELLPERLPNPAYGVSGVWNGTRNLVFGGQKDPGTRLASIMLHDPAAGTTTLHSASLPAASVFTSAAWTGSRAYVFGGGSGVDRTYCLGCPAGTTTTTTTSATTTTTTTATTTTGTGTTTGTTTSTTTTQTGTTGTGTAGPQPGDLPGTTCAHRVIEVELSGTEAQATLSWKPGAHCPADAFLVWRGAGTELVATVAADAAMRYQHDIESPGPGVHVYYVQAVLGNESRAFGATPAYSSNPLALGPDAVKRFEPLPPRPEAQSQVDEPSRTGERVGLTLLALLVLGVVVVWLFVWRKRR
jgi:hypothetical protein